MFSYHIFYFPFKWKYKDRENLLFSEQVDLRNIPVNSYTGWEWDSDMNDMEKDEFYNERNYYYPFVHPILYDDKSSQVIVKHYEHKSPKTGNVKYNIKVKKKNVFNLEVKAINLNLYATGVGMLNFYLENDKYGNENDILCINQFGRRIFPPFIKDVELRGEIAEFIEIEGLHDGRNYKEDFSAYTNQMPWEAACFIKSLIADFSETMIVEPVIDDRMFVNCTYSCQDIASLFESNSNQSPDDNQQVFEKFYFNNDFWYKYLFVDTKDPTCQNQKMRKKMMKKQTYTRWQGYGSLYGVSRYSLVLLMGTINNYNDFLPVHMRTTYSRMVEMILINRASILKFSNEVTKVSKLVKADETDRQLINRINALYEEYIQFVNLFFFNEVTAQDQGIELYKLMLETLKLDDYVKNLDKEIEELHRYVMMLEEREHNKKASVLNTIATMFLPATLLAGLFGMSFYNKDLYAIHHSFWKLLLVVVVLASVVSTVMILLTKNKKK